MADARRFPEGPGGPWVLDLGIESFELEPIIDGTSLWFDVVDHGAGRSLHVPMKREHALELADALREFGETGKIMVAGGQPRTSAGDGSAVEGETISAPR